MKYWELHIVYLSGKTYQVGDFQLMVLLVKVRYPQIVKINS